MTEPDLLVPVAPRGPAVPRPERPEIDGLLRAVARGDDAAFARSTTCSRRACSGWPAVCCGTRRRPRRWPRRCSSRSGGPRPLRLAARQRLVVGAHHPPTGAPWTACARSRRASDRVQRGCAASVHVPYDEVAKNVGQVRLERQQVRRWARRSPPRSSSGRRSRLRTTVVTPPRGRVPLDTALPTVEVPHAGRLIRLRDCLSVEVAHDEARHPLLGGRVRVDAVDDLERVAFDVHLAECEACATEVAEYRETATRLAEDSWSVPPPRMREPGPRRAAATPQAAGHRPPARCPVAVTRWCRIAAAAADRRRARHRRGGDDLRRVGAAARRRADRHGAGQQQAAASGGDDRPDAALRQAPRGWWPGDRRGSPTPRTTGW